MFDYEALYKPYTVGGATLEKSVAWAKKVTNAPDLVVEQALAEIMYEVSAGKDYRGPCQCGCGMSNPHTGIEHALRDKIQVYLREAQSAFLGILQEKETKRMELKMRQLSSINKAYLKENKLPLKQRSPVLRKLHELFGNSK